MATEIFMSVNGRTTALRQNSSDLEGIAMDPVQKPGL